MSREDRIKEALTAKPLSEVVAKLMAKDPEYAERIRQSETAMKPILDDLDKIGYRVESLWALKHQGTSWESAIPVLLHWLPLVTNYPVKEEIISCLSVPWTGKRATQYLIEEFEKYAPIDPRHAQEVGRLSAAQFTKYLATLRRHDPSAALAETIGNALSIVDVKGFEKEIIKLCRNPRYGLARAMMVMNLNRLRDPEAEEAALDLLTDSDVRVHAIMALGKMKSKRALFQLEKLLTDKNSAVRKESRKAITKIMREPRTKR